MIYLEATWFLKILNETDRPIITHRKSVEEVVIASKFVIIKEEINTANLDEADAFKEPKKEKKEDIVNYHEFPVMNFLGDKYSPFVEISEYDEENFGMLVALRGENEAEQIAVKVGTMEKKAEKWVVIGNQISGSIFKGEVESSVISKRNIEVVFDKYTAIPFSKKDKPILRIFSRNEFSLLKK